MSRSKGEASSLSKKFFAAVCLIFLSAIAYRAITGPGDTNASPTRSNPGPVVTQAPQSGPSLQPAPSQPPASLSPKEASQRAAVARAATYVDLLTSAMFLPETQVKRMVNAYVVPDKRADLELSILASGPVVAKTLLYENVSTASIEASYNVKTNKYKFVSYDSRTKTAVIRLFTDTHFVTASGEEILAPTINIVTVRLVGSNWLYVSSAEPPANEIPAPVEGLTYDQTVQRFNGYLEGYVDYVQSSS